MTNSGLSDPVLGEKIWTLVVRVPRDMNEVKLITHLGEQHVVVGELHYGNMLAPAEDPVFEVSDVLAIPPRDVDAPPDREWTALTPEARAARTQRLADDLAERVLA